MTSEFKIGQGTIKTTNLTADYDAAASTYKITGGAAVALGNNMLQANFGDNGTSGIVITNGSLAELGFTTSSVVKAGGLSIKTSGVTANYVDSTDTYTLTGDASFALQNSTVNIGLGADSTSGLKIVGNRSRLRTKPAQATTDKHRFTQIEINSQSVFIRVHLWFKLSFLNCRERLRLSLAPSRRSARRSVLI